MIINVLNKDLIPVTFIDNDVPGLPSYYKDTLIEYLGLGTSSFEFTILKTKNNTIQDYSRFFNRETSFSFAKGGKQYAVFPAGSDGFYETDTEITYKCLSLDRELSLEYVDKLDNTSSHSLQWYIDYFGLILNSQIEIGQNDVSDYTRVIKYDSQDTKLNRLISLINNFDGEFEFVTKLSDNGSVDKIILNIVKKRDDLGKNGIGSTREDVELVYGKNVKGIERTYNFEFFNASKVTGKDGINWNSSEFSYVNSDGVEEFYKRKNEDTAFAPLSAQKYPAHLRKDSSDIWLRKNFETEYTTPAQMWGYIVQQFKSYAYPQVTYKVKTNSSLVSNTFDGKLPIQIGDTITIEDDNFSNDQGDFGLILRARATQIKSSESNPESNEITFENFVELQNELSDDLISQVNQLVDAATPYIGSIDTTNGTQFKNGTGSTTLSAHIYKGSATTETTADSYEWLKDGTVVAPTQTITVDASGVANKAVYSFKATVGGKVVASQSVTITNVNDGKGGADGKTSYTHVAWANSSDGTDGFTTVYPNLNLLKNTRNLSSTSTSTAWSTLYTSSQIYDSGIKSVSGVLAMKFSFNVYVPLNAIVGSNVPIQLKGQNSQATNVGTDDYNTIISNTNYAIKQSDLGTTIRVNIPIQKSPNYQSFDTALANTASITIRQSTNISGFVYSTIKLESGSTATPWMPSSSEVTTADWPSYIGQYSDFTATASTDPAKYAPWTVFKGNDGNNGRGIVSSEQKYQLTQTSAKPVDPWDNSVWQTTQPTTTATNKYLWSITRTTFNLAPLTQDIVEQKAVYGDKGTDGDPGKIVSDTEPTTRFKGLTWKYSGTTDLTASDRTVIKPNTEYYYNGTHWVINYFSVNNFAAESITSDKIDGKNLTITDGEFVSTTTNGPVITSTEIKDNHIAISKTDGTVNTRNDIALDSEQGLAQKFTNIDTGFYRTAGINYQGPFTSDSDGNYAQLTPQGTKLSTDVPWTTLAATGGFSGSIQFAIQNGIAFFSLTQVLTPKMTAEAWYQIAQLPSGSKAIPSINRVTTAFANTAVWGFYVSTSGGLYLQSKTALNTPGSTSANTIASFPIG